jgi:hypothetical protein
MEKGVGVGVPCVVIDSRISSVFHVRRALALLMQIVSGSKRERGDGDREVEEQDKKAARVESREKKKCCFDLCCF